MSHRPFESMDAAEIEAALYDLPTDALAALVRRANREYWEEAAPSLPDPLYDRIVERLRDLAPDHPVLSELGAPPPPGAPIRPEEAARIRLLDRFGRPVHHDPPMLSLDKVYDLRDLDAWARKIEGKFIVMPKLDGVAVVLHYVDGRLVLAATRGSGREGEDITRNLLEVPGIPHRVEAERLQVRGEIYMPLSAFAAFAGTFANPRNLAAGTLKQKEADRSRLRDLAFAAWELTGSPLPSEDEKFALLSRLSIPTVEHRCVPRSGLEGAILEITARREHLDVEIDGIVIRAEDTTEQQRLGSTEHHPRYAMAFKFQGESGRTHVEDVLWSVSRSGTITPVALVSPITLSGATVSRASLANLSRFTALGLRSGSVVEVTRRGGVIPYVERVVEPGDGPPFPVPTRCPACGGPVRRRKIQDAEFLECAQPKSCAAARVRDIEHFARVLDIKGFGPKTLARLMEAGLVSSPVDLFRLRRADVAELERLGEKSAANLLAEVERNRRIPLAKFLAALGIPHVGPKYARILAERYGTLEALRKVRREDLARIPGIKDAIADAVVQGLSDAAEKIDALLEHVAVEPHRPADGDRDRAGPLAGTSFVFTGALASMTRAQAQARVRALGAQTPPGVSRKLTHLVVGEEAKPSSKLRRARALVDQGVPIRILDEAAFLRLLDEAEADTAADDASP